MTAKSSNAKKAGKIFRQVWMVLGGAFFLWIVISYQPRGIEKGTLESGEGVTVESDRDFVRFYPSAPADTIFIFYPGSMVSYRSYAPLCRRVAEAGYEAVLVKMPWRMPEKGYNKITERGIISDSSKYYILAGHSKGGAVAARFVYENPQAVDKLILVGTTHPKDFSLADCGIPVMKLYASDDRVAKAEDIMKNREKLPDSAEYVMIEGGNHSGFGYYGRQLGDGKASITRKEQQEILLKNILRFIEE